jgi:DNA-binding NarL/FixJ family response regulator
LIVDADAAARAAISSALERAGYRTEQASTGEHALDTAQRECPAVAIVETHLPGLSGYEVCREFRDRYGNDVAIIFISAKRTEETDQVAGLLLGADDYLPKPFGMDRLLAHVRRLASRLAPSTSPAVARLTRREREVLELLTEGLEQEQIARRLFISPRTVAKHVEHILAKLGVRSRAQAVAAAMRTGRAGPTR